MAKTKKKTIPKKKKVTTLSDVIATVPFKEPSYWKILKLKLYYNFFHWKIHPPRIDRFLEVDSDGKEVRETKIVLPRIENTLVNIDFTLEESYQNQIATQAKKYGLTFEEYTAYILEQAVAQKTSEDK